METNGNHLKFAELWEKKKELKAALDSVTEELENLGATLIEQFMDSEVQKVSLKNGITLRLDRKIWPKVCEGKTTADVVSAIRSAGLPELLAKENFQTNVLAAFLRELDKQEAPLPKEFEGVIAPNPVYKIVATKY